MTEKSAHIHTCERLSQVLVCNIHEHTHTDFCSATVQRCDPPREECFSITEMQSQDRKERERERGRAEKEEGGERGRKIHLTFSRRRHICQNAAKTRRGSGESQKGSDVCLCLIAK